MTKNSIIVGTRGSKLALWQADFVIKELQNSFPDKMFKREIIKTKGDKILDVALSKIGSKGLFTKELEIALLNREIDIAVHSMKDLPTEFEAEFKIGAVLKRHPHNDILISLNNLSFSELPEGSIIGTSSLRRQAQLQFHRKDMKFKDLRGNVDTRIGKLDAGQYDAIILARAGVERLGRGDRISQIFDKDFILPAVGQGAIGIEILKENKEVEEIVKTIEHEPTKIATDAERSFMNELQGGCQVPIGAYGYLLDGKLILEGLVANLDGTKLIRATEVGEFLDSVEIGVRLSQELIADGASDILSEIRR